MNRKDNPVDWSKLGLPPDLVAKATVVELRPKAAKAIKRSVHSFDKFPREWRTRLANVQAGGGTYRVALHLIEQFWRTDRKRLRLANVALLREGVSRQNKRTALHELETAGLIRIEQRTRKSPFVHLLMIG